jgi:FkbM family methyltransferase
MRSMIRKTIKSLIQPAKALRDNRLHQAGISPHDFDLYNLQWLLARHFSVVLDIGAARGSYTLLFHRLFPAAKIIAFEPHPESFAELTLHTQGLPNIAYHHCALSDQNGIADFHLGGPRNADSSSLLPMGPNHRKLWPGSGTDQCVKVQTRRLDSLFEVKNNERVFVKMDVQGGELMVIKGGLKVFSMVDTIVVEASIKPLYVGGPAFHVLYEQLISLGFEYAGIIDQVFSSDGSREVIQNDVIFRRR